HTGDGKTVQGGTPHGYVGYVTSSGLRYLTKLIWNGTGYTLSSQTIAVGGVPRAVSFDGARAMLMIDAAVDTKRLVEVDTGNTTQIDRGTSADIGTGFITPTMSYDRDGNIYLLATDSGTSDLYRTKWTRATTSWDATWTLVLAGTFTGSNLRKGYAFANSATIEGVYSDAAGISYQQVLVLNTPPTAPTVLTPADGSTHDVTVSLGLSWQFNDPDSGDAQTAYTVRRRIGVLAFNYWNGTAFVAAESSATKIVSSAASVGLAAGWGADADSNHFYSVKTWDSFDSVSPWSAERRIVPSAKDNPTITDPASDGFDIITATYTVVWTVQTQTKYRIRVIGSNAGVPDPAVVDYDSGELNSTTARSHSVNLPVNSVTRQIELTTWNDEGLASTVVYRIVDVVFVPPATPILALNTTAVPGAIRVTITNPAEGPTVGSNDLYRQILNTTGDGIRVATGVARDGVFVDYAVASRVEYSYWAKAIATTGATAPSPPTVIRDTRIQPDEVPIYANRSVTILTTDSRATAQGKWQAAASNAIIGWERGTHNQDFYLMKVGQTFVGELDPLTADQFFPMGRPITIVSPTEAGAVCRVARNGVIAAMEFTGINDPDVAVEFEGGGGESGFPSLHTAGYFLYSHHNSTGGLGFSGDTEISWYETSWNGKIGIKGRGLSDTDVRGPGLLRFGKSTRNNNALLNPPEVEAGGSKFLVQNDLVCEDLLYEDNGGPGHWVDFGGSRNIARRITARRNHGELMWEITTDGIIEDCVLVDKSTGNAVAAGALYLSNAAGRSATDRLIVRRCQIEGIGSHAALASKDEPTRSPRADFLLIEDNVITKRQSGPGLNAAVWCFDGDWDLTPPNAARPDAIFRRNQYQVATGFRPQGWGASNRAGWSAWQGLGYDLDSTLST
ncbi:MAG: hypothetical protein ABR609_15830, partial [Acidimicrobiia bacterium]